MLYEYVLYSSAPEGRATPKLRSNFTQEHELYWTAYYMLEYSLCTWTAFVFARADLREQHEGLDDRRGLGLRRARAHLRHASRRHHQSQRRRRALGNRPRQLPPHPHGACVFTVFTFATLRASFATLRPAPLMTMIGSWSLAPHQSSAHYNDRFRCERYIAICAHVSD